MSQRAVISAIGPDRPGIVNEIAAVVRELDLNIEDSRMTVLGGEFAILMSVTGPERAVAGLEPRLARVCGELGLVHLFRPTVERDRTRPSIPYRVRVRAMDHPGIVHEIARFFSARQINIEDLNTETRPAAHTGTPIFDLTMRVQIPPGTQIRALRSAFESFCDEHDLDGVLDPSAP
jgi:glycine cleavage system transcriptional repressor